MQKFGTTPYTANINQAGKPTVKYIPVVFSFTFSFLLHSASLVHFSKLIGALDFPGCFRLGSWSENWKVETNDGKLETSGKKPVSSGVSVWKILSRISCIHNFFVTNFSGRKHHRYDIINERFLTLYLEKTAFMAFSFAHAPHIICCTWFKPRGAICKKER